MISDRNKKIDRELQEYRQQQIKANKNRQSLFRDYDRSTITTNIGDPETPSYEKDEGVFSSLWNSTKQTFSDLWSSINYDMDKQAVDSAINNVDDEVQRKQDLELIQEYYSLVNDKQKLINDIYNDPNLNTRSIEKTLQMKDQLDGIQDRIQKLDSYFLGEGRTHTAIAENMFDGTKLNFAEQFNATTWKAIKSGWGDHNIRLGLSKYGVLGKLAGGALEGLSDIITRPTGVLGEILSGAYGEAKDIVNSIISDEYSTSSRIQNYIKNLSGDDDTLLKQLYVGEGLINRENVRSDIARKYAENHFDIERRIDELKEAQDDLKYGRLFGIDGAYDYNAVSENWKKQRKWYQEEGGFWDGFIHPFLATQDIASSLDMMKYQIYAQGVDGLIRRIPAAFIEKHPFIGTVATAADVAAGIAGTVKAREEETGLEKIGAIGQRVQKLAQENGADLNKVMTRIKEDGEKMGIDTSSLDDAQLWQLGIAFNINTGDRAFEEAKLQARKGINKLINANNALGINDYMQMLPYMSYHGDVTRHLKGFGNKIEDNLYIGNKTLGQRMGTRMNPWIYENSDKRIIEQSVNAVDGFFAKKINKAASAFMKKDMPKAALFTKHAAEYAGKKFRTLGAIAASESVEEGQQNLLQSRYERGEYDDYRSDEFMFDINEFVANSGLALTAVADYLGLGFYDADNNSTQLRQAMNVGFWSSWIQSQGQHALTNLAGASNENITGLAKQFYDDKVAVRILADEEKRLQDQTHIDMFYDRFRHGANWNTLYTSLNDLKNMIDTRQQKDETYEQYEERMKEAHSSLVKQQFIDDDIKLMTATWALYSDEGVDKLFKEKGINKKDEKYRQFLRDGATALMDYHKTLELVQQQSADINGSQEDRIRVVEKMLDPDTPQEELRVILNKYPKLVNVIDKLRQNYKKYLDEIPGFNQRQFDNFSNSVKTLSDFLETVGKQAIIDSGVDEDIQSAYGDKKNQYIAQAQRIFSAKDDTSKQKKETLLREAFKKQERESFVERLSNNKKAFVNNYAIRDLVKDKVLSYDERITAYLENIFENDKEKAQELIDKAYEQHGKPKSEVRFIIDQMRMLHNLKKRKAIGRTLVWAQDQATALENIQKMTGLDVDPSRVQGWADNLKEKHDALLAKEKEFVGENSDFETHLGEDFELDDEQDYNKLLNDYFINSSILKAQAKVANTYRSLKENPLTLKNAIFGKSSSETILDEIVSDYQAIIDRRNARSEADRQLNLDDITDIEDMQQLSKQAAWAIINARIEEAAERNKVVHRNFDDDVLQQQIIQPVQQEQEEEVEENENIIEGNEVVEALSDAEKALRKEFYHETGKKQNVAEEIEKRKQRLKDQQEDEEDAIKSALEDSIIDIDDEEAPATEASTNTEQPHIDAEDTIKESADESTTEMHPDDENADQDNDGIDDEIINNESDDIDSDEAQYDGDVLERGEDEINADNIRDAIDNDITDEEPSPIATPEEDISRSEGEIIQDAIDDDISEEMDMQKVTVNELGEVVYDGDLVSEEMQEHIKDQLDQLSDSDEAPVPIDQTTAVDDEENVGDIIGEPSPNLIYQTMFYAYDEDTTPIKLSVNGVQITEFNGKPLKPGKELAQKLVNKNWLKGVKSYYVVTQSLQAKNTPNNKDAFTVALILEDETASYACIYKSIGETISISSSQKGRDGNPKVYHINSRQILKNNLLLHNMDVNKLLDYVGGIKGREADTDLYNAQIIAAYKDAVNSYAREQYAQNYAQLHADDPNAKEKAYRDWDSIKQRRSESEDAYAERLAKWENDHNTFNAMARLYFSKPGRMIFSESQIDEEIDRLKQNRDEIIDAYLEKDGENYIFPETPHIGKVQPLHIDQSNGRINSVKTQGGKPVYRNVVDPSMSMEQIQDQLDNEELLIGIGKGKRPSKDVPKHRVSIVKYGFSRTAEDDELFKKGGVLGKLYMFVSGPNGKHKVPIMLAEEKFDVQHRQKADGSIEAVPINTNRKVVLCIDPLSKELLNDKKEKPSAAEVLLYMILGELSLPGIQRGERRNRASDDESDLVSLFINASTKTLLEKQPDPNSKLMQTLASKQLYYGAPPVKVQKKTASGKVIDVWEEGTGPKMFNIGLPEYVEVQVPTKDGFKIEKKKTYVVKQYTKDEILSNEELRQNIVQAIATQMHWNTDDYTFGESASVDASRTILGKLVLHLIEQDFKNGTFDKMTPQQIIDHKVSIMGCPQLSFRIGDFYSIPETGARQMGDFKEESGSVLAWMIKSGKIKTDTDKQIFAAPFVFASGVKPKSNKPVEKAAQGFSIPIQEAKGVKQTEKSKEQPAETATEENTFYDESKEQAQISKVKVRGLDKSGINIPKTLAAAKEKINKWVEFLKSTAANNKKFANRIDVDENEILDMILFSPRSRQDICEYAEQVDESGLGISEEDDEELDAWNDKLRDNQLDQFIEKYNSTHSDKINKDNIDRGTLKHFGKLKTDEVEAVIVYKDRSSGQVKVLFDTITASTTEDKTPLPFDQRHYIIKAATGVFSKQKTKGKFDEKSARKWLSDTLGIDQSEVQVWDVVDDVLHDPDIYGAVDVIVDSITNSLVGQIGLRTTGGASVHYHEAWHYVNLLLHTEQERQYLYKVYLSTHKGFAKKHPDNREIEERMAEDFRKWVLLQEDMSIIGRVKRFFVNALDFLRIFNKKQQYRDVFDAIINGEYKKRTTSQQKLAHFKKEWREGAPFLGYYTPGTTQKQREEFQYISNHQQYFDASAAIAKKLIQNAGIYTEKDVRKMKGKDYGDMLKEVQDWIDTSDDLTQDQKNLLSDVMKHEDLVKRAVRESFEELGLTAKIRTMKSLARAEGESATEADPNLTDKDPDAVLDEASTKEAAPDNTWDRFDLTISKKDNASVRTKLFMRQIPILKRSYDDKGNVIFVEDTDTFGLTKTYSFKEAWNLIVDRLWQCESIDDKDKNGYKKTSLLGIIDNLRKSNEFYESLYRALTNIQGNNWDSIVLRSQIYATINSNRPQVSYLRISDPLENFGYSDPMDDSFDDSEIIRNGAVADVERVWDMKNDNEEEISRNLPREWSKALTAHGLLDINKEGNNVISKNFAKSLKKDLAELRKTFDNSYTKQELNENIDDIIEKVIDFYNRLSIPLDRDSLMVMMQMSSKRSAKITNQKIFNILKEWFNPTVQENTKQDEVKQNTLPLMADAIIAAANSNATSIKYGGDNRERQLDELFANFKEGTHIYKLAKAINLVHPSAKEFSIKSPNGDRIYPISQNSFVSDRIRQLSTSEGKFAAQLREKDKNTGNYIFPYCSTSILLDCSEKYTKPFDQETHFKLNAFVGIKDMNRPKGADYFGITPMEDYIAKLMMTEDDQIILPTMADKKTWFSISHKNLKLCHDAMLVLPYKDTLDTFIQKYYEKEQPRPEDPESYDFIKWKNNSTSWYRGLDQNSEVKQKIDSEAAAAYKELNKEVQIMRYSDDTLTRFGKYMMAEVDTLIQYYSEKNIQKCVKQPHTLIENYHGQIYKTKSGQSRMDFSGNGGKFRYFYDIIAFTDKNGKQYNLNQRLQYLYELQKRIEAGQAVNVAETDPLYKFIGQLSLGKKKNFDGFELIREELNRIKTEHFKQGMFISDEIKNSINSMLITTTKNELEALSDKNSPYKLVKKVNGMYIPNGIPTQLIRSYANKISKTLSEESTHISTTQGMDPIIGQDALFSLIANYVANSAISTIEFEKVFSGDPAFYSIKNQEKVSRIENKKDLPKKGKSGVTYIVQNTNKVYKWNGQNYVEINPEDVRGVEQITDQITLKDGQVTEQSIYVDVMVDNFSDKIKRLGSALSPGDEMRLHYTDEEISKYPELAITDYTNMNVEDINAQSMYLDHVSSIFKKQLLIDHIRSIDKQRFEEYCIENNLKFENALSNIYTDEEFFKKIYDLYSDIHKKVDKELKSQLKPYNDITVSDAQVFVRPSLYRKIRIGLGQWSYDDEKAYKIIEGADKKFREGADTGEWLADEKLYNAVRRLELYPLKMSYFQNDPNKFAGAVVPGLNKMAVFPLFKFQATTDTSRKLYERMNKKDNQLDMISFKSAVKVGAHQNAVKMSKDGSETEEQICTIDDLFNLDSSNFIDYNKRNGDKANENYGQINHRQNGKFAPVQIQSLSNLRMQLNTEHHDADSRNIGTQMFKLAFSNIIDDADYNGKSGEFIKKDIMRIIKELTNLGDEKLRKKFFNGSIDPNNPIPNNDAIRKYIQMVIDNNGLGVSAEEIFNDGGVAASIASREVFENSVTSLVDSEVVDIDMPGGTAIQQSVFGFVGHGNNQVKSQVGAYKINYNNGDELIWDKEDGSMEVIMSINFFRSVLPKEIKQKPFTEQKQWLIDNDIIKGKKTSGEMSNPTPYGMGYRIPTQGMSSMFAFTVADVMPPLVGDLIIVPREFTAQTGSDFDVDKLFLATYSYKDGVRQVESKDNKSKGALTNSLLDHYMTLITDVKNFANARASIDVLTDKLKTDFVQGVIRNQQKEYLPGFTALTPRFQIDKKREFSIGKEGIAPFALNVTNLSLTQLCHLTMRYDGVVSQYGFGNLDQIYGKDGRRIADWLSAMVNAHVDVAKDPYIFDLNINHATYNYANFLIRAGMGMSTFTFLAQQSLKNIADEINNAGGIYGGNIDGSTPESEIYKKKRSQCILHEYKSILYELRAIKNRTTVDGKSILSQKEQEKLDNLIAFAQHESSTKKNEEKDEEVPTLSYARENVFDENKGISIIEKGRSEKDIDKIEYYEHQLACIRCFQEISEHAQAISSLVSASQIDTKKFGNTIRDQINFRNKIEHIYEDGSLWTINEPGFDAMFVNEKGKIDKKEAQREAIRRYFNDSYLDHKFTTAVKLIQQMLKSQLFTATDEFREIFTQMFIKINGGTESMYEKELNKDKIKAMGCAIDNIMRFNAMFNAGVTALDELPEGSVDFTLGGNKAEVIKNWKRILFGDENTKPLYLRLGELQKNLKDSKRKWDYFDLIDEKDGSLHNDLLDILIPQAPNSKFSIGRITLATSLMDKDSQSRRKLMASFAQLLNSKSEDVADIAKDLIFYAYYSSYDQNIVNSFFDLVPPKYRKQYDKALSNTLALLNSSNEEDKKKGYNIIYDNEGLDKIIDVICRNYWYDDNIVPRHYPQEFENENKFINSRPVYGPPKTYNATFGFPQYVVMKDTDNTVKKNTYFKIKIGKEVLLYRRIGMVQRTSVKNGKLASPMYIYAPIPKAGLHQNGTHQFEFYADYTTPSVFEDNRISTNFSHDLIREEVEKAIEKPNARKDKILDLDIIWSDATIPAAYDKMNRQTYTTLNISPYEEVINKVLLMPSEEISDGHFKDPEEVGMRAANVIVEINSSGKTEIVSKEQDKKKGINEKYLQKVVTLNANKNLSKSLYKTIKDLLVDETRITKRIYLRVGDKQDIEVTEDDIKEYLGIIGADGPTAKRLLSHNNVITAAVKQYKINKCFLDLINKLKEDGIEEIYTDCAYYFNTSSAEAVQFAKLMTGNTTNAHVHISNYAQFKDPKQLNKLRAALNHRKEDYNLADTTPATELLNQIIKDNDKSENKAQKIIDDVLEESSQIDDDIESEAVMDIDLGSLDDSEKIEEQPAILKQIDENNKDKAQDQQCAIQSALEDSLLD